MMKCAGNRDNDGKKSCTQEKGAMGTIIVVCGIFIGITILDSIRHELHKNKLSHVSII